MRREARRAGRPAVPLICGELHLPYNCSPLQIRAFPTVAWVERSDTWESVPWVSLRSTQATCCVMNSPFRCRSILRCVRPSSG